MGEFGDAQEIGAAIALIVAASLALQSAMGPAMNSIVEAIEATGWLPGDRYSGVISLVFGTFLGIAAGWLAFQRTGASDITWIGIGAFAGLIGLGAGGVRSRLVVDGYRYAGERRARAQSEAFLRLAITDTEAAGDAATGGTLKRSA